MPAACAVCGHAGGVGAFCPACGTKQSVQEDTDAMVGRSIADRYEILAPIKHGGMGSVYAAMQRTLGRKVAIKLIQTTLRGVDQVVQRFMDEARIASQFNHPNLVSVYDFGQITDGGRIELF